jgi:CDP-paratose 2-epimerase
MKLFITGGCGFLGSNLAFDNLNKGNEVLVFDNLYRNGSRENLIWLKTFKKISFIHGDIRNQNEVENAIKSFLPDVIYHLAGQVAMTTSIENPRFDFEVNVLGTLNVLESIRKFCPETIIIYSSTNKVYGDLDQYKYIETTMRYECIDKPMGFDEKTNLDFHSPYGCSKGSADQYVLDYSRIFNLKTLVFRHSSMYGGRQFATFDQGWIGWFCQKALNVKNNIDNNLFTISGNGKQVRDVLHIDDMKTLYNNAVENINSIKGEIFNIGGGINNSLSLLELFDKLEKKLDIKLKYTILPVRESDQRFFVANISKAKNLIYWVPKITSDEGLDLMLNWTKDIDI